MNYKTQCIKHKISLRDPDYFSFPVFRWFLPDLWLSFCSLISDLLSPYSFCPKSTHQVWIKCSLSIHINFCQGLNHSIKGNEFYSISVNNKAIQWEHFNTFWTAESCFCWSRSFSSWNRASSIFVLIWIFYKVLENLVNYCNYWFTPYTHIKKNHSSAGIDLHLFLDPLTGHWKMWLMPRCLLKTYMHECLNNTT